MERQVEAGEWASCVSRWQTTLEERVTLRVCASVRGGGRRSWRRWEHILSDATKESGAEGGPADRRAQRAGVKKT